MGLSKQSTQCQTLSLGILFFVKIDPFRKKFQFPKKIEEKTLSRRFVQIAQNIPKQKVSLAMLTPLEPNYAGLNG